MNAPINLLVDQRMVEGRILVELAAVDCANSLVDAIHAYFSRRNSNDWTVAAMDLDSGTIFYFSPSG